MNLSLVNKYRREILISCVVFMFALILRLGRVFFEQQPIFADEAIYIRWAQIMRAESTLRFIPLSDGKQPLFMWILIPFLKVISDPLFAGRILSVFSGMATLVGVLYLSYLLFKSHKISITAGIIYAISPFSLFFDSLALVDSMLTAFGIWTFIFSYLTIKTLRLDLAMITGFFLGAAMLTKSPAIFFALLLPLGLVFTGFHRGKLQLHIIIKIGLLFLATFFITLGIFNILRLGPNFHMIGLRNQDYVFPLKHIWENPKDPFIFHVKEIVEWLWILGPSALLFLFPLGIVLRFNKSRKEIFVLAMWIFIPLFVNAMYAKVFTARYIFFVLPYVYIISASIFSKIFLKSILTLLLSIFIIHSLVIDYLLITKIEVAPLPRNERNGYLEEWTAGVGIKETAKYLADFHLNNPTDKMVVGTEGYFGTLPDGLQMYLAKYPEITVIGVGLDLKEVPDSLIESKKAGNMTLLVINESRLKARSDNLGLKVLAAYPKPFRKVGTKEYNLMGPRDTLYLYEVTDDVIKVKDEK